MSNGHMGAEGANPAGAGADADDDRALLRGRAYQLLALGLALESTTGTALEAYALPEGVAAADAPYANGAFAEDAAEDNPVVTRRCAGRHWRTRCGT